MKDFAKVTLEERYMLPNEKSPQDAYARAAAAFADDIPHAQRLYDYVSRGWFMFATPLLSNGGAARGLPISCFLTTVEDDLQSIFDHYSEVGWMSAKGGGVGSYYGELRSLGTGTSKGSQSSGIMPFVAVDDRLILAVSQGGTRRGSHAIYIDIHHPEIEEFIVCRKGNGGDDNRKALNLHNAINITDEFMIAVRDDLPFNLRDPHSGAITKTLRARDLWTLALETRMQTGEPYFFFKDTANRGLPATQRAKGLTVNHSNLCVSGWTEVLTRDGYKPIGGLAGSSQDVWNGRQWSTVNIRQTGRDQELVRVWFEDGGYIDCTPYHKFYDAWGGEHRAGGLKDGTVLEAVTHPTVTGTLNLEKGDRSLAYTAGWTMFAGFEDSNRLATFLTDGAPDEVSRRLMANSVDQVADDLAGGSLLRFEPQTIKTGFVPLTGDLTYLTFWLAGALDAVGQWITLDGDDWLTIGSPDQEIVRQLRLLALQLGFHPRVRYGDTMHIFSISASETDYLFEHDILANLESRWTPCFESKQAEFDPFKFQPVVADVQPLPYRGDTYCFTENLRSRGTFNGILTGNCTEITLATGRDDLGNKRTAVCCLSSVNGEKYDEWKDDPRFIEDLMRMLDNCLDVFIQNAPPALANAVYSAGMERSVGLGLLGFHSYLQKHRIAFESEAARYVNRALFSHLRRHADLASLKLGQERGEAPDMLGTGHRFAHRIAVAPNASSSILVGASPSVEPERANIFLHKTLSGSFTVRNAYLERELQTLGLNTSEVWKTITGSEGSIQHFDAAYLMDTWSVDLPTAVINHLKDVFKTATELDQRWVVQHAVDRQPFIDQAQSINLFFAASADATPEEKEAHAALISQTHFMAWAGGLKSLYYLRSTTPGRAENVNKTVERTATVEAAFDLSSLVTAGIGEVVEDEECFACQG